MRIPLSQAHRWVPGVSRSKTYTDADDGTLTATKDPARGNHKYVEISELERCYGRVRNPDETEPDTPEHTDRLLQQYENRILDLQKQLDLANARENDLTAEKTKLLDMLSTEQEKTRLLLPTSEKRSNWFTRLIGAH